MVQAGISGVVERITFRNEENGYTVFRLDPATESGNLVFVVGTFTAINVGESLQLSGEWVNHPRYGKQFQVESYHQIYPVTDTGLIKFLGSGLIKGIGPVAAKRIVSRFGKETLQIIDSDVTRLTEVDGIGPAKIAMIEKGWGEQKAVKEVMLFLASHNISTTYAVKLYKQYGSHTIRIIQENPYQLVYDVYGIGFKTADKIASDLGFEQTSLHRIEAGIHYVLHQASEEGHTYLPLTALQERADVILGAGYEQLQAGVEALVQKGYAFQKDDHIYLHTLYKDEEIIALRIITLNRQPLPLLDEAFIRDQISKIEKKGSILFGERQREALLKGVNNPVFILTGGPGTGKTTLVMGLLEIFRLLQKRVALCAPTGRAAKRLEEASGQEAKTIHRLLEYNPRSGGWTRNHLTPVSEDVIIADECSMLDTSLAAALLQGISNGARLLLIGDIDQLPSVGPGNVLKDLIQSGAIETVHLDSIYRQDQQSRIVVNAHRINAGEMPITDNTKAHNYFFKTENDSDKIPDQIVDLCQNRLPREFNLEPVTDVQILTPMYKGACGAHNLNAVLQAALNPHGTEFLHGSRSFRVGDKIMQVRNNYDKDVFNGDIGCIAGIDTTEQSVICRFDAGTVLYDFKELDEITLAYAVSVHKSQGSEYRAVIMPVVTQHFVMLQRNLLYTALTRAKDLIILIGSKKALAIAVKNAKVQQRYTTLARRIANLMTALNTPSEL